MKPLRIRAENYGPFPTLDIPLAEGATVVLGELLNAPQGADSNGAGKSHVLNAIPIALFGAPRGFSSLAQFVTHGQDDLMVELEFEHLGETYRVRRGYSARGRGKSTLDFERLANGAYEISGFEPLTQASAKDTQALIESTIGMTEDTFRRSAFLEQGARSFAHPDVKPAERKELISSAIGLEVWGQLADHNRGQMKAAELALWEIQSRVEPAELRLAERPGVEAQRDTLTSDAGDARVLAAAARSLHETETQRAADLDRAEATWTVRNSAVATARAKATAHMSLRNRGLEAQEHLVVARQEVSDIGPAEDVTSLEQQERELVDEHQAYAAAVGARTAGELLARERQEERFRLTHNADVNHKLADEKRTRAAEIETAGSEGTERCDHCEQLLGQDAAATVITKLRDEAETLDLDELRLRQEANEIEIPEIPALAIAPVEGVLQGLRVRLSSAREMHQRIATLQERIAGLERTVAETDTAEYRDETDRLERELSEAQAALAEIDAPEPGSADAARDNAARAKTTADSEERRAQDAFAALARVAVVLEQLDELANQVAGDVAERDRLRTELDLLSQLDVIYGRDGVPAFVVDQVAVPIIEHEANELLRRVGMSYRVELRSQRETQAGAVVGALDVAVLLADGGERPYSRLSGGEASRVLVALQHGLTQLLKRRRSADVQMFALDELPYLDAAGRRALADTITELAADYPVRLIISHDEELRDAFDSSITVSRDSQTGIAVAR